MQKPGLQGLLDSRGGQCTCTRVHTVHARVPAHAHSTRRGTALTHKSPAHRLSQSPFGEFAQGKSFTPASFPAPALFPVTYH